MADGKVHSSHRFAAVPEKLLVDDRVGHRAVRLWAILHRIAWQDDPEFPSRPMLAEALDASVDTIDRDMKELIAAGWLIRTHTKGGVNDYELVEAPVSADEIPGVGSRMGAAGVAAWVRPPTSFKRALERSTPVRTSSARQERSSDADTDPPKKRWADGQPEEEQSPERLGGKSPGSPTRRPGSGAGLAQHFRATASAKFTKRQLGPSPFNDRALAKEFTKWMREDGVSADQIRTMIGAFCLLATPTGKPVWTSFLAARARLFESAARVTPDSERGERFRLAPEDTNQATTRTRRSS